MQKRLRPSKARNVSKQNNKQNSMIIKTKQVAVLREGTYNATVGSVDPKPNEAKANKIVFGFKVEGYDKEVTKDNPTSFAAGSPLRTDTETIIGRSFTTDEANAGVDLKSLVGYKCQIVVYHKAGSGGRPKPAVSIVRPAVAA
jgi:hypothetical protein